MSRVEAAAPARRAARASAPVRLDPAATREQVLAFALGLPGAWEDHPWGERVAKVGKKVFAFFGLDEHETGPSMTVKLVVSHPIALAQPGVRDPGYGLGRSGWVWVRLRETDLPVEVLRDWIVESYRAVAPKRLVAELDARETASTAAGDP